MVTLSGVADGAARCRTHCQTILWIRSLAESAIRRLPSEAMAMCCGRPNRAEALSPSANSMVLPAIVPTYPAGVTLRILLLPPELWSQT